MHEKLRCFMTRNNKTLLYLQSITVTTALVLMSGCGPARKADVPETQLRSNPQLKQGQLVFMHTCNQCHVLGGPGVGPGINDKPLPAVAIKTQVRAGAGAMPAFSKADISDEELDALVKYLQVLRQQPPLASR
jgi:mono/diheme cytochrome c family protein